MSLLNAHVERSPLVPPPIDVDGVDAPNGRRDVVTSHRIEHGDNQQDEHSDGRLLSILDRIGCGYLTLEKQKRILTANVAARRILLREAAAIDTLDGLTLAFKRLLSRAQAPLPPGRMSWIAVPGDDEPPVIFNRSTDDAMDGASAVILLDLGACLTPSPLALQRMFGLTMAETRLALQLARGDSPAAVARSRNLSRTTVRSQLASIFSKTQTRRQADLVLLLARVAVLP